MSRSVTLSPIVVIGNELLWQFANSHQSGICVAVICNTDCKSNWISFGRKPLFLREATVLDAAASNGMPAPQGGKATK
jgi:hypothetical protein